MEMVSALTDEFRPGISRTMNDIERRAVMDFCSKIATFVKANSRRGEPLGKTKVCATNKTLM